MCVVRTAHGDGSRSDIDDPSKAVFLHRVDHLPRTGIDAVQVHIDYIGPFSRIDIIERLHLKGRENGRVIDQDIDPVMLLDDGAEDIRHIIQPADIELVGEGHAASSLDLVNNLAGSFKIPVQNENGRASCGKRP